MPYPRGSHRLSGGRNYRRVAATLQNDATGTGSGSSGGGGATAPANTVAPVASGTATVGQTLSTTNGTWTGTATIVYSYQWQRDGVNIGSATASTYLLVAADASTSVRCVVTGTNGVGNASANSNAISVGALTYAQQVLADSPGGYWRLNDSSGTLTDSSGNGHNLATVTGLTYGVASLMTTDTADKAISNAGAGYGSSAAYTPNTPPFTVEGWVKHTSSGVYQRFAAVHNAWQAGISSANKWTLTAAGVLDYEFAATATVNVTYHAVFVFDTSQDVSLYINGAFSETVAGTTNPNSGDKFVIGAKDANTGSENWIGIIDEVAYYPSALSAGRIAAHYAAR